MTLYLKGIRLAGYAIAGLRHAAELFDIDLITVLAVVSYTVTAIVGLIHALFDLDASDDFVCVVSNHDLAPSGELDDVVFSHHHP